MLINRTYRTWVYDYPRYYSGVNVSGGGHGHAGKCPNSITSLVANILNTGDFTSSSFLTVNINSTMGDNSNYLVLYDGNLNGLHYDMSNPFFGNVADIGTDVVSNGFIKLPINGSLYYVRRYLGPTNSICSTAMRCQLIPDSAGTFVSAGFVVVEAAGELKFIKVFTLQ